MIIVFYFKQGVEVAGNFIRLKINIYCKMVQDKENEKRKIVIFWNKVKLPVFFFFFFFFQNETTPGNLQISSFLFNVCFVGG